jgi:PAS domain S-box-containing protein
MIPQMVWNAGADGEISYINQRWLDYTGISLEKAAGRGWLAAVHPDDVKGVYTAWQHTVSKNSTDTDLFNQEFRLRRAADGTYRWMLGVAVPLYKPDGTVDQWIGAMADIDDQKRQAENLEQMVRRRTAALLEQIEERKRAEQKVQAVATELSRSNAELEQFAYVASHDLQEPLRKIQAFGDRLRTKVRDELPETGREYVDRMLNSAGRMRRLIDDLLTFSRVTTQPRSFTRTNLCDIVEEVVNDLSERIEQAEGTVKVGELPEIDADPTQMRQLFQNLIANAVKFQRPGAPPVVEIAGEVVNDSPKPNGEPLPICRLTIRDNGIGFDEKYLDRIFQVFQRLHGREEYEGTGIGLAICRKIVERHGGAITARSRLGEGTAFVVSLPIRQPHPAAETPPSAVGDSRWREAVHTDEQRKQETNHDLDGRRRSGRSPADQRGVRGEPPGE